MEGTVSSQEFCLIVTIKDPTGTKPVYNEANQKLNEYNFWHNPIEGINSRIKMKHRRSAGREGLELLNAYMVIPIKLINPYIRL